MVPQRRSKNGDSVAKTGFCRWKSHNFDQFELRFTVGNTPSIFGHGVTEFKKPLCFLLQLYHVAEFTATEYTDDKNLFMPVWYNVKVKRETLGWLKATIPYLTFQFDRQ